MSALGQKQTCAVHNRNDFAFELIAYAKSHGCLKMLCRTRDSSHPNSLTPNLAHAHTTGSDGDQALSLYSLEVSEHVSALGHSRTFQDVRRMSALHLKADVPSAGRNVR